MGISNKLSTNIVIKVEREVMMVKICHNKKNYVVKFHQVAQARGREQMF